MKSVAVSGLGIVSALGPGKQRQIDAFRNGRTGISLSPGLLETVHRIPVGEVRLTNEELSVLLNLKNRRYSSRTALLGMLAASEALKDAGLDPETRAAEGWNRKYRIGLVSSTSVGGMDRTEIFFRSFLQNEASGRLRDVRMHDCAASTAAIADYCGINGYTTTVSTACSSAANAILLGARLLQHRIVDCVVAGGTDALSVFTLNGFRSLMILDEKICRPFDASRSGLNLGEGAGYIVMQNAETLDRIGNGHEPYCFLSGYANRNDAFHQTASSGDGEGAYLAMKETLSKAGISPSEVSYINAHGTGTGNNDLTEGTAMKRLFGQQIPPFSSTKAFTGHTLAAAGGIEAVFSALAVKNGFLYPNLNFRTPIEGLDLVPQTAFGSGIPIRSVLSNSFGFGGNCSSLLFTAQP